MLKRKIYVVEVNLQEGLFLDQNFRPVGAYNRHQKILIAKHPETIDEILPFLSMDWVNSFTDYNILNRRTDSFALSAWNPAAQAHTALTEFKM